MKNITLITLIIFFIISGTLAMSLLFSKSSSITAPTVTTVPTAAKATTDITDTTPTPNTNNTKVVGAAPKGFIIKSPNVKNLLLTTNTKASSGLTLQELSKHNTPKDCFLGISGKVYDVSSYISKHPGGRGTITKNCGKEVTSIFAKIHSNRAWDILKKYKVDSLSTSKNTNASDVLNTLKQTLQKSNPTAEIIDVRPRSDYFLAKILLDNKLYEVHINSKGDIFNEEVAFQEPDWNSWQQDTDDK